MDAALVASAILGVTMLVVLLRRIIRNPKDVLPWVWIALGCFVGWLAYLFGVLSDALHVSRFVWNIQMVLWTLSGFGWATLVVTSLERPWPVADRRPSIGRAMLVA